MGTRGRGRPEAQVDPEAGPVQAFASGLRQLRKSAGLTYKQLSVDTHYASNTLSQAADGKRLPSREVTRAFVEACGGDWQEWEARRRQVLSRLGQDGSQPGTGEPAVSSPDARQDPARPGAPEPSLLLPLAGPEAGAVRFFAQASLEGAGPAEPPALPEGGASSGTAQTIARPEAISSPAQLAAALSELRERSRLTVRELARLCELPTATVGGYLTGAHLPTPKIADSGFMFLLEALGVRGGDLEAWREAVERVRVERRGAAANEAPYRGLAPFGPQDAAWFFGREALVEQLLQRAADRRAVGAPLVVVGPSGVGKSSVLGAGLIPRLARDAPAILLTPGRSPLEALEQALAMDMRWLVIDQFEELFTQEIPAEQKAAFIDAVLATARGGGNDRLDGGSAGIGVVIGLRADFYAEAVAHPQLADVLQDGQVVVGSMTERELGEAIVRPARQAGLSVEAGLVELLLRDLATGRAETSALPLLSHALLTTWQQRRGTTLTVSAYLDTGGIAHAIAQSADNAFSALTGERQELAHRIFLHLVRIADGSPDTIRRVEVAELREAVGEGVTEILAFFVERRLLTVDADFVQISHEALIGSWPRLQAWLAEDRAALLAHRRIAEQADTWIFAGREPSMLLRGSALSIARDVLRRSHGHGTAQAGLREIEHDYITASLKAQRRSTRLRRLIVSWLVIMTVLAVAASGVALHQLGSSDAQAQQTESSLLVNEAESLRKTDPTLAAQLSLAAYSLGANFYSRSALLESSDTAQAGSVVTGTSIVDGLVSSPDGRIEAALDADASVRLWNIADPQRPALLGSFRVPSTASAVPLAIAMSPDGRMLAVSWGGAIAVWNIADPAAPRRITTLGASASPQVIDLAFSPDGTELAGGTTGGSVLIYRVSSRGGTPAFLALQPLAASQTAGVSSLAFAPDARTLAVGIDDGHLALWNIADPAAPVLDAAPVSLGSPVSALAYSPDGHTLATGTHAGQIRFWTATAAGTVQVASPTLAESASWVNSLQFSPDGTELAVGDSADTAQVWNARTHTPITQLPHPGPVSAVGWDGAHALVTGCADGELRLWQIPVPQLPGNGPVNAVVYSPDGTVMAVAGSSSIQLWDAPDETPIGTAFGPADETAETMAITGAKLLAAGFSDGSVRFWDIADPAHPRALGVFGPRPDSTVNSVAFNPTGTLAAAATDNGSVYVINLADPAHPAVIATLDLSTTQPASVAFSPDGDTLAIAGNTTTLWQVNGPTLRLTTTLAMPGSATSIAFNKTGTALAAGSTNGEVYLWDTADPAHPAPVGHAQTESAGSVSALAFSPDGAQLASAESDGSLWILDTADLSPFARLTADNDLYTVAYSPDGRTIAAAGSGKTVQLWQTDPRTAQQALCSSVGQTLNQADWARYAPNIPTTAPCG